MYHQISYLLQEPQPASVMNPLSFIFWTPTKDDKKLEFYSQLLIYFAEFMKAASPKPSADKVFDLVLDYFMLTSMHVIVPAFFLKAETYLLLKYLCNESP